MRACVGFGAYRLSNQTREVGPSCEQGPNNDSQGSNLGFDSSGVLNFCELRDIQIKRFLTLD